jgi:hypothetical protein
MEDCVVTCLLPIVVAVALAADPAARGLPFSVPPGPEDAVISRVAPPQCLFYANLTGTGVPSPSSRSETEKLLAEPEVQEFLKAIGKVITDWLKKQDEEARKCDRASPADQLAAMVLKKAAQPDISRQEIGELLNLVVTHPMALFVADVKVAWPKKDEAVPGKKHDAKQPAKEKSAATPADEKKSAGGDSPQVEVQAGLVVSLGSEAPRWREKLSKLFQQASKAGKDSILERIDRAGETWYRIPPTKSGDRNHVTFGFHGNYFVAAVGDGTLEGMLARWQSPSPPWLTKALAQTAVPRRASIIYCDLKTIRAKFLAVAEKEKQKVAVVACLELLGLNNVDSLVATSGLEDNGMIDRTLLALDGKPRGLLDVVSDRPLTAADLEPIPSNALLAFAARVDLDRSLNIALSACEMAANESKDADLSKQFKTCEKEVFDTIKKEYGIDIHRFLSSAGDTCCVYNSPTEGEIAYLGWTAVVGVRDRPALVANWEKLCALSAKAMAEDKKNAADAAASWSDMDFSGPLEFRKCRYAGREVYYLAGQAIAPAFCISDRAMVMTLNMPAMKAYLTRKNHHSLAELPAVALALRDATGPVSLWYCDTPKLFDFCYPLISFYGTGAAGMAHRAKIDLEPTYWPSAPAIRAHLQPDITTVQRTPAGLQVTSRYSVPWDAANGLVALGLSGIAQSFAAPSMTATLCEPNEPGKPTQGVTPAPTPPASVPRGS